MDIIKQLKTRIQKRLTETKNPCKSYKTEAAAQKALESIAQLVANHYAINQDLDAVPARYVVFYMEEMQRWVGAIDLSELLKRDTMTGGYIGLAGDKGFYTY